MWLFDIGILLFKVYKTEEHSDMLKQYLAMACLGYLSL